MSQSLRSNFPSVLLALLGCLLIGLAAFIACDRAAFLRDASGVIGTIVSLNAGTAHPNVEFTTSLGQTIQFSENGWISYGVNERVRVLYDPADPEHTAWVDDPGAVWFAPSLLAGLGFFAWLLGALAATRLRRFFASNIG
jgi:hypothetical protein